MIHCPFCGSTQVETEYCYEFTKYTCSVCSYWDIIDDWEKDDWNGGVLIPVAGVEQDQTRDGLYSRLNVSVHSLGLLWTYRQYMQFYDEEMVVIDQTWNSVRQDGLNAYYRYFNPDKLSRLLLIIHQLQPDIAIELDNGKMKS